jgi:hypothetical protein
MNHKCYVDGKTKNLFENQIDSQLLGRQTSEGSRFMASPRPLRDPISTKRPGVVLYICNKSNVGGIGRRIAV